MKIKKSTFKRRKWTNHKIPQQEVEESLPPTLNRKIENNLQLMDMIPKLPQSLWKSLRVSESKTYPLTRNLKYSESTIRMKTLMKVALSMHRTRLTHGAWPKLSN